MKKLISRNFCQGRILISRNIFYKCDYIVCTILENNGDLTNFFFLFWWEEIFHFSTIVFKNLNGRKFCLFLTINFMENQKKMPKLILFFFREMSLRQNWWAIPAVSVWCQQAFDLKMKWLELRHPHEGDWNYFHYTLFNFGKSASIFGSKSVGSSRHHIWIMWKGYSTILCKSCVRSSVSNTNFRQIKDVVLVLVGNAHCGNFRIVL